MSKEKERNLWDIFAYSMVFAFLSMVYLTIAILNYGITNDYLIYNLQNVTDDLANQSVISNVTQSYLQDRADEYRNFNFNFDNLWFLAYMMFLLSSFGTAYRTKQLNYFSFLSILFYGMMFILFIVSIFETLTNWFRDSVLLAILPNVVILLPKFYYYLDHVGIFTTLQIVVCLVINVVDLDFTKIFARKKQEQKALGDEEVV